MSPRAVLFDLFGTLVPQFAFGPHKDALAQMAVALGVDRFDFVRLWLDDYDAVITGKRPTVEACIRHVCNTLQATPSAHQIRQAIEIRHAHGRQTLKPRPDAIETLRRLKTLDLTLGLLTNCAAEVPDLWPHTPFASIIDRTTFSCKVGLKKPDLQIYARACADLSVPPDQTLFVGDGASRELCSAQKAGLHALKFKVPTSEREDNIPTDTWIGPETSELSAIPDWIAQSFS